MNLKNIKLITLAVKEKDNYETVTVTEAYNEQKLVGYKCSSCGETK